MIDLACAADAAYLPHAATMLKSALLQHQAGDLRVHFLHLPDLAACERERLQNWLQAEGVTLRMLPVTAAQLEGLPDMGRISVVMWLRIFLPQLAPDVERVLYLDCDTLIHDSLQPLWQLELSQHAAAVVPNIFPAGAEQRVRRLPLSPQHRYFNSGVILMNLDYWRRRQLSERIVEYARRHRQELLWPDQDALNVLLQDQIRELPARYNAQNSFYLYPWAKTQLGEDNWTAALSQPAITHFEGPGFCKPWHDLSTHAATALYRQCRAQTPWSAWQTEGRRWFNPLLRLLPMKTLLQLLDLPATWQRGQRKLRRRWRRLRAGG